MKLCRQSFRGVTSFRHAVDIDLESLGGHLIALVGVNGAGKSTTAEAAPAVIFKRFPTRPGFYENFHGRDAYIEAVFEDAGDEIKIRIQVDAEQRKTEGYVFINGEAVTSGRAAEFDRVIADRFGSYDLFVASVFAGQNKAGNFLDAKKTARKELFAELLGLARIELLHQGVKERRSAVETTLDRLRTEQARLEVEISGKTDIQMRLGRARSDAGSLREGLSKARETEEDARTRLEQAKNADTELRSLERAVESVGREVANGRQAIENMGHQQRGVQQSTANQVRALTEMLDDAGEDRIDERFRTKRNQLEQRRSQLDTTLAESARITEARTRLEELGEERDKLARDDTAFRELTIVRDRTEANVTAARDALKNAQRLRGRELGTLTRQTELLGEVPCTGAESWLPWDSVLRVVASGSVPQGLSRICPLLTQARQAQQRITELQTTALPEEKTLTLSETALRSLEARFQPEAKLAAGRAQRLDRIEAEIESACKLVARQSVIDDARRQLDAVNTEMEGLDFEYDLEIEGFRDQQQRIRKQIEAAQRDAADRLCSLADQLVKVKQNLSAAEDRQRQVDEEVAAARKRLAGDSIAAAERTLSEAKRLLETTDQALRQVERQEASLSSQLENLAARETEFEQVRGEITTVGRDLTDWKLLETALGRDGIQALEIDAAGPEVARLTNELLESCYGPRFSISFETLREKKTARGEYSEAFDVKVYDRGEERLVESLSGGERVIVGEAVSLALAIFNARKNSIKYRTLWRDETAGALDPENAQAYVQMLRRARDLGGFEQVIFVSHQPAVWEMADVRLFVRDGKVSVEEMQVAA